MAAEERQESLGHTLASDPLLNRGSDLIETPAARGDGDFVRGLAQSLFDGNAFGEVAGLIDVAAAADGDVIGQQLQRNHFENR
jgi:hypothetical protein